MAWPPTVHQDVQDEVSLLRNAAGHVVAAGQWYEPPTTALGNLSMTVARAFYVPLWIGRALVLDRIAVNVQTAAAGSTVRLGIYGDSQGLPGSLVVDAGSVDSSVSGSDLALTISQFLNIGWVWLVAVGQGSAAPTLRGATGSLPRIPQQGVTTTGMIACLQSNLNAVPGALPATAPLGSAQAVAGRPNIAVRVAP